MLLAGPLMLIVGFSGGADTPASGVFGALDIRRVPAPYQTWVLKAARMCPAVTGPLIAAQIDTESGWDPQAHNSVGAQGLGQFLPSTWAVWGSNANPDVDGTSDPYDPADAIMALAAYDCANAAKVSALLKAGRASGDLVALTIAAYNAGPAAVEQYHGIPPFPETQQYVKDILAKMAAYTSAGASSSEQSAFGARTVSAALRYLGTPYVWGGGSITGPTYGAVQGPATAGFDCSGLVLYAIYQASAGRVELPHSSEEQATMGQEISDPSQMKVGDVVAFQLGAPGDYDHIGIYIGGGQFIQAPKTGDVVKISDLSDPYYAARTKTIRRFG